MKTFLNEEMKPFRELTDEQMAAVIRSKIAVECEIYDARSWNKAPDQRICFNEIYRTKPPKQFVIPWSAGILPEFKFAAYLLNDRHVWIFEKRPQYTGFGDHFDWISTGGKAERLSNVLVVDTTDVNLAELIVRPEGV